MAVDVVIPNVGESVSEVVILQWLKKEGEWVEKDEAVCELQTDKANSEVTAPESGVLHIGKGEGETVAVGAIIATVDPKGSKSNGATAPAGNEQKQPVTASGKSAAPASAERVPPATPVARKMAAELGVDLGRVEGSGAGGKITREDVEAAATSSTKPAAKAAPAPPPPAASKPTPTPAPGSRAVTRERMTPLRKKIAARLVEAQHTAAMLTTFNECDMSAVMDLRTKYKESFQKKHGIGLGFMSFFVKAAIEALRAFPRVNAYIEGDEIVHHHYQDIGVAVGTDRGLVVPVIRNAEALTFAGIESAIRDFAEKARTGKLTLEEMSGGTFTISNGGVYGSMMSTPILNPPQSGILGMHNIVRRPIAVGEQVVIRPMMYLALSYDHRIVDGREAVGFLVRIKECIESPERLLLEI